MQFVKYILLFFIFIASNLIGKTISQKYKFRLNELEEIKNALNIFKTKIKFTYSTIGEIFEELSEKSTKTNIRSLFKNAKNFLEKHSASEAWQYALENTNTNMKQEDIEVLKNLGKLLGTSDVDGQIAQIDLTQDFLEVQIKQAQEEKQKNEKLYQKLGSIIGLGIVVILI